MLVIGEICILSFYNRWKFTHSFHVDFIHTDKINNFKIYKSIWVFSFLNILLKNYRIEVSVISPNAWRGHIKCEEWKNANEKFAISVDKENLLYKYTNIYSIKLWPLYVFINYFQNKLKAKILGAMMQLTCIKPYFSHSFRSQF